jgi:hypothetical protein
VEFGELQDVDLREAWPNEASDFTPWLAENLERLSAVIGLPLELEATEVPVEGFSADILARIPDDDGRVLIENQLEGTDHRHLGQILTYLAGLEAQTVIWVARRFHSAHLSAIRWLNEHTTGPFAFFAVTVRVVRIGDAPSPVAPLFEVVERPDEWSKGVKGAVETGVGSRRPDLRPLRRDFWNFYAERYPSDNIPPDHSRHEFGHRVGGVFVYQTLKPCRRTESICTYLRRIAITTPTPEIWHRDTMLPWTASLAVAVFGIFQWMPGTPTTGRRWPIGCTRGS